MTNSRYIKSIEFLPPNNWWDQFIQFRKIFLKFILHILYYLHEFTPDMFCPIQQRV